MVTTCCSHIHWLGPSSICLMVINDRKIHGIYPEVVNMTVLTKTGYKHGT